jgi:hypothetical protein
MDGRTRGARAKARTWSCMHASASMDRDGQNLILPRPARLARVSSWRKGKAGDSRSLSPPSNACRGYRQKKKNACRGARGAPSTRAARQDASPRARPCRTAHLAEQIDQAHPNPIRPRNGKKIETTQARKAANSQLPPKRSPTRPYFFLPSEMPRPPPPSPISPPPPAPLAGDRCAASVTSPSTPPSSAS